MFVFLFVSDDASWVVGFRIQILLSMQVRGRCANERVHIETTSQPGRTRPIFHYSCSKSAFHHSVFVLRLPVELPEIFGGSSLDRSMYLTWAMSKHADQNGSLHGCVALDVK